MNRATSGGGLLSFTPLCLREYKENEEMFEEFCSELPQVSEETNSRLKCPLDTQELHAALQSMQGCKAPGINVLTVKFYKAYRDILAHEVWSLVHCRYPAAGLPSSFCLKKATCRTLKTGVLCLSSAQTIGSSPKP